jgi:hypothetical protein
VNHLSIIANTFAAYIDFAMSSGECGLSVFSTGPMHYEAVLGYLQIQSRRKRELLQDYAALAGWLTETVYLQLLRRHLHLAAHVIQGLRFIDGIVGLSQVHKPLWVFSLNHDCIIECLAAANNIAISAGLVDRSALALRSPSGSIIGELPIETISSTEFNEHSLRFFRAGHSRNQSFQDTRRPRNVHG